MLPRLVLIEQAVSRLFSIRKRCGKGNCEKAAVGSRGDRRQQGGPGIATKFVPGGTDYSAVDSPWGPLSKGDCPRRDSTVVQSWSVGSTQLVHCPESRSVRLWEVD